MGYRPCLFLKMSNYFCFGIQFLLGLLSRIKLVFVALIRQGGFLIKQEHQQVDHEEQSAEYVLLMEGQCPTPVPVPVHVLTRLIKKRLPVVTYAGLLGRLGKQEEVERSTCLVCLDCIQGEDKIRVLWNCSHVFHRECLDAWVDHNKLCCPCCRSMMLPNNIISSNPWTMPETNSIIAQS